MHSLFNSIDTNVLLYLQIFIFSDLHIFIYLYFRKLNHQWLSLHFISKNESVIFTYMTTRISSKTLFIIHIISSYFRFWFCPSFFSLKNHLSFYFLCLTDLEFSNCGTPIRSECYFHENEYVWVLTEKERQFTEKNFLDLRKNNGSNNRWICDSISGNQVANMVYRAVKQKEKETNKKMWFFLILLHFWWNQVYNGLTVILNPLHSTSICCCSTC